MNRIHYPFRASWDDALGPAFALGQGAAAPSIQDFIAPTRLLAFNEGTEDNVDFTIQFPHDLDLSMSTLTLGAHVHWTAISSPAANALLRWDLVYTVAKPAVNVSSSVAFPAVTSITTPVNTLTGHEYRKHLIDAFPDISLALADCAPSMIMVGNLRINGGSTIGNNIAGLLSFDIHYLKGPYGTASEYA
jgi:hypothetical protein